MVQKNQLKQEFKGNTCSFNGVNVAATIGCPTFLDSGRSEERINGGGQKCSMYGFSAEGGIECLKEVVASDIILSLQRVALEDPRTL